VDKLFSFNGNRIYSQQEEIIIVKCQVLILQDQNSIKENGTGQVTMLMMSRPH